MHCMHSTVGPSLILQNVIKCPCRDGSQDCVRERRDLDGSEKDEWVVLLWANRLVYLVIIRSQKVCGMKNATVCPLRAGRKSGEQ